MHSGEARQFYVSAIESKNFVLRIIVSTSESFVTSIISTHEIINQHGTVRNELILVRNAIVYERDEFRKSFTVIRDIA